MICRYASPRPPPFLVPPPLIGSTEVAAVLGVEDAWRYSRRTPGLRLQDGAGFRIGRPDPTADQHGHLPHGEGWGIFPAPRLGRGLGVASLSTQDDAALLAVDDRRVDDRVAVRAVGGLREDPEVLRADRRLAVRAPRLLRLRSGHQERKAGRVLSISPHEVVSTRRRSVFPRDGGERRPADATFALPPRAMVPAVMAGAHRSPQAWSRR